MNKMPDLNRDGLSDYVSFKQNKNAVFHLNAFPESSLPELSFSRS